MKDVEDEILYCGAPYKVGGSESFGSDCDNQDRNHYPATKHEGPCPFGTDQRVRWEGGGSCAGDPLPFRNVEYIDG